MLLPGLAVQEEMVDLVAMLVIPVMQGVLATLVV